MASNSNCNQGNQLSVIMTAELHTLLNNVTKIDRVTSYRSVMDALKTYILVKRLHGISNPCLITVKDDPLGAVFGVSEFTVLDVKNLLCKVLSLENNGESSCEAVSTSQSTKRKCDELNEDNLKKLCTRSSSKPPPSPIYIDIPPPFLYDSSSESCCSIQGYETMIVKDTSDDLYFEDSNDINDIFAIEDTYNLEYEVESLSNSSADDSSDTDSEVEDALQAAILSFVSKTDSDVEFWADQSSEDEFEFDIEISEFDKWKCCKCGSLNEPPMRYCVKCWDERNGWLPEKTRTKRRYPYKRQKRKFIKLKDSHYENIKWKDSSGSYTSLSVAACSSQESTHTDHALNVESLSQESTMSKDLSTQEKDLCLICCTNPKNATIIHGNLGHNIACYTCAKKLKRKNSNCPYCRRTINKVVHHITV